jgi:beta-lactamase class D
VTIDKHNIDIIECSLIRNRVNNIGKLFAKYTSDGQFTIYNCYIDETSFLNSGDCVIINTITSFYYNFLILIKLDDCFLNYKNKNYFHYIDENNLFLRKLSCYCKIPFFSRIISIFLLFFQII